jgi:hypothetical protein
VPSGSRNVNWAQTPLSSFPNMSIRLHAEMFAPSMACSRDAVNQLVRTLLAIGLRFEYVPGRGGSYWSDYSGELDCYDGQTLEDALEAYSRSGEWAVELHRLPATGDEPLRLLLSIAPPAADGQASLHSVHLSLPFMPSQNRGPTLIDEFAAITKLVAGLTGTWYGWAGSDFGLFHGSTEPITASAVAALVPLPIEWLNIYGPPYRDTIGLDRLLTSPAWRSEFIANGGFAITLGPEPRLVSSEVGRAVADHLGVPVALP